LFIFVLSRYSAKTRILTTQQINNDHTFFYYFKSSSFKSKFEILSNAPFTMLDRPALLKQESYKLFIYFPSDSVIYRLFMFHLVVQYEAWRWQNKFVYYYYIIISTLRKKQPKSVIIVGLVPGLQAYNLGKTRNNAKHNYEDLTGRTIRIHFFSSAGSGSILNTSQILNFWKK